MTALEMTDGALPSRRKPVLVGSIALALLVIGLGTWATFAMIDGAVVAGGRVIVESNRQAVQHPDGGVVAEVLVKEGARVAQGDVLIRLDPTLAQTELGMVENQLYEVMARRGRLTAERDGASHIIPDPALVAAGRADPAMAELSTGQQALFEARRESLHQAMTQLENQKLQLDNQVAGIDAVSASLARQIALTEEELRGQESLLEKGLAQGTRVLNLRREAARLAGAIGEARAQRAQAMERIAEIEIERLKLMGQRREEAITTLRDLKVTELDLEERRTALRTRLARMEIRAPSSGVVYDVRLTGPWSVLKPAEAVLFILPTDRPLLIESRVSPLHVNKVHPGQEVIVRFPSFDMRETPDLIGRVRQVSPDTYTEQGTGAVFYRAEVELPEVELKKLSEGQVIVPGMPVDTFLRTGEYSPLAYLLRPLTRFLDTAMREGS
ncbi:MAG: Type secretion system rane fusion protein PrsE [Pseudomonadota bacterium]